MTDNVKVKQATEQLELKHSQLDRRQKQSYFTIQQSDSHRNSPVRKASSFDLNRDTVRSIKPVMWYHASARKYRCCKDDSIEVDTSNRLKKQETVLPPRNSNSCPRKAVNGYNPNDNKQRGDR